MYTVVWKCCKFSVYTFMKYLSSSFMLCFLNQHLGFEITDNLPGTWPKLHKLLALLLFFLFLVEIMNLSFSWQRRIKEISKTEKIRAPFSCLSLCPRNLYLCCCLQFQPVVSPFLCEMQQFYSKYSQYCRKGCHTQTQEDNPFFLCSFKPSALKITTLWSEDTSLSEVLCKSSLSSYSFSLCVSEINKKLRYPVRKQYFLFNRQRPKLKTGKILVLSWQCMSNTPTWAMFFRLSFWYRNNKQQLCSVGQIK